MSFGLMFVSQMVWNRVSCKPVQSGDSAIERVLMIGIQLRDRVVREWSHWPKPFDNVAVRNWCEDPTIPEVFGMEAVVGDDTV